MSHLFRTVAWPVSALSFALACAACSKPEPPDKHQPPEPQVTALRDAIHAPIARGKAVEPVVLEAAQKQREQIDAQTGG